LCLIGDDVYVEHVIDVLAHHLNFFGTRVNGYDIPKTLYAFNQVDSFIFTVLKRCRGIVNCLHYFAPSIKKASFRRVFRRVTHTITTYG
jgi:hypothetical protein